MLLFANASDLCVRFFLPVNKHVPSAALVCFSPCVLPSPVADKPCAFLLFPVDDSQDSDGMGSAVPVAGRAWSTCTMLTMVALTCLGWVVCFGWPSLLKEKGVARSPATTAPAKKPKEGDETLVDAVDVNVTHTLPAANVGPEVVLPLDLPSNLLQEATKEAVVLGEQVFEEAAGDGVKEGTVKDLDIPNAEVPGEEVSTAAESGEDTSVDELTGGESVAGQQEELSPSASVPPSAPATAMAEMAKEENGDFAGAAIAQAVPSLQEEPQTPFFDGEVSGKELGTGEFTSAENNSEGVERCGKVTKTPEPISAEVGSVEVAAAEKVVVADVNVEGVEGGGVARAGEELKGDVCNREVAEVEVALEQLPAQQGASGEALEPLDTFFTFGDKPLTT